MKKFAVRVFGCQMNSYDGDRLRTAMIRRGWSEVPDEEADAVILVTCSIREKAEQKAASEIGRFDLKYRNERSPIVILVGCMAQRIGVEMSKKFTCIRLISGPRHLGLVPQGIEDIASNGGRCAFMDDDPHKLVDLEVIPTERRTPCKAYVTITYGCDRFCTYCIVPYVRGRLQSRNASEILEEVRSLSSDGAAEVTLLGQNVDAYGKDLNDGYGFASLLYDVSQIKGIKRLRFATSHPKDFDEDILEVMASTPSICRAINLPVQSGSNSVLKAMNRGYTVEQYLALVERIRTAIPDVSLTTDIIVGFPGETDQDFRDSFNLLSQVEFDIVHTAAYSPRKGTKAAVMENQIDNRVKAERLNEINEMQSALARKLNEGYAGRVFEVLVDGFAPKGEGLLQGRTMTDKVVIFPGQPEDIGRFVNVRITRGSHWSLEGEVIE